MRNLADYSTVRLSRSESLIKSSFCSSFINEAFVSIRLSIRILKALCDSSMVALWDCKLAFCSWESFSHSPMWLQSLRAIISRFKVGLFSTYYSGCLMSSILYFGCRFFLVRFYGPLISCDWSSESSWLKPSSSPDSFMSSSSYTPCITRQKSSPLTLSSSVGTSKSNIPLLLALPQKRYFTKFGNDKSTIPLNKLLISCFLWIP